MKAAVYLMKIIRFYREFGMSGLFILNKEKFSKKPFYSFQIKDYQYSIYHRPRTSDLDTFIQVIWHKAYEVGYGLEPKTIVDCGANIGLASIQYGKLFPKAKIFAIEPDKGNFDILKLNTQGYSNITPIRKGVWNKSTNLRIKDNGNGNWGFQVEEAENEDSDTVPSISLRELIDTYNIENIDILKVDIEGSEKELFEYDCDFWLSKTKTLIIEVHDWMNHGAVRAVFSKIINYDFYFVLKGENMIFYLNR